MTVSAQRTGVLVLGVHRSGTSVTAGLLARAGFALPRTLIPADAWNERGYFESSALNAFHERLLRAAGSTWDAYTRLNRDWMHSGEARVLQEEGRHLLRSEYGHSRQFVLKDPRVCRFVPFWLRIFEEEHIRPKAALVLRPPFDVARSLLARDNLPLPLGALIWLRHVLDAEFETRAIPRTWAPYSVTIDDWRQTLRRLRADLGDTWVEPPAGSPIEDLVQPHLHHHQGPIDTSQIPDLLVDWLRRTEDALAGLVTPGSSGEEQATQALDTVRDAFDRSAAAFGGAEEPRYVERRDAAEVRQTETLARAEQLAVERDLLDGERLHVTAERDRLQTEHQRLGSEHERLVTAHAHLAAQRADLTRRVEQYGDEVRALTDALDESRDEVRALRTSLSWKVTAPLRTIYSRIR